MEPKKRIIFKDNGYQAYKDWSNLSLTDKLKRRLNIAKAWINNGSLGKAGYALFGGYDPTNPTLITGDVPNPGIRNPKNVVLNLLKVRTIAQRAAKISDKIFDKQYQKAIVSGDPKRILAVRNLHFNAKAPDNLAVPENLDDLANEINTPGRSAILSHASNSVFNSFDINRTGQNYKHSKRFGKGVFFGTDPEDTVWGRIPRSFYVYLKDNGKISYGGSEVFINNPAHIKSYDALTFDDAGKLIPISKRDNFDINDIRYKKGGKTHRPFGHRSILDNGWQSTKLLKNKKNVYGK